MGRFVLFFVFLLLLSAGSACRKETAASSNVSIDPSQTNAERVEDVDILYSDSAVVRVRVRGPVMLNFIGYSDPHQEFTDGIRVEFFDRSGYVTSVLTARYAIRYETRGLTIIRDKVLWKSVEGRTLETPELTWDERQQKIYSPKFAVVTSPTDTVYTHGFEATQDFKMVQMKAIDGSMRMEENAQPPAKPLNPS
ncbi:MAG: hypothetical protein IPH16_04495 [Haliscomenobacter sp.]|nr:hypothetical protein [Haliscomenobacter sp.]MBK7474998.1 hypothetical protein [Haliscomenobacter sp.]MBK8880446.1 hypothetical protein [Haliscomenobacter sp.]